MIDFTGVKAITIPEGVVKQITRKSDGVVLWKAGYKNWVKYSTTNDGKTIYNGGLGYKNGYRVRSGGAEAAMAAATCTGFIPASAGDVIGLGGAQLGNNANSNAINVYDASYTNLGQVVENYATHGYGIFADGKLSNWNQGTTKNNCYYWTVPNGAGIAFVRVTGRMNNLGENMIVTVNEEIT